MISEKKLLPLQILKILKEHTDDEHPITQSKIIDYLTEMGYTCDRKTVSRNINLLIDYGYNIIKISGGGCFYVNDTFDSSELTFLVDAIYSSPAISQNQAMSLIDRLTKDVRKSDRERFRNIFKPYQITRTDNKQIFYNIDQINKAIDEDKKISFYYNMYNKDKQLVMRKDKRYVINPYFMTNSKGKYFVACNKDNHNDMANYRIDYMTEVSIVDEKRRDIKEIEGFEKGFNPAKYANEHIYMFSGKTIPAKIQLYNDRMINEVLDWFGKDVKFYLDKENNTLAELNVNEYALTYWALQYGENVKILSPEDVKQRVKDILLKMLENYEIKK